MRKIAHLRRAQRRLPRDRDIAAVRSALEQELGETVSIRTGARFMGVSHAALSRWIKSGDLPTVHATNGRQELPVPMLLDLHEQVNEERQLGKRKRHLLEPALLERRELARRTSAADLTHKGDAAGHGSAEQRGLAYHRAVARRLNKRMADEALYRVWKWRDAGRLDPRYADAWERILELPIAEVRRAMTEDSQKGHDLRQNSPFAGMLSEPERRKLLEIHS